MFGNLIFFSFTNNKNFTNVLYPNFQENSTLIPSRCPNNSILTEFDNKIAIKTHAWIQIPIKPTTVAVDKLNKGSNINKNISILAYCIFFGRHYVM